MLNQCKDEGQSRTRKALKEDDYPEMSTFDYTIEPSTSSGLRNDRDRRAKQRATKRILARQKITPTKFKGFFEKATNSNEDSNPSSFDLPREMQLKVTLPGDDKSK